MTLEKIYEDNDVLVINKPSGLVVHSDGKTIEKVLTDYLLEDYPQMKEVGEPTVFSDGRIIYRPGVVHRIDKETSGVLVVAKNQQSYEFLKKQFKDRDIKKIYRAIVWGHIKNDEGVIDQPIGRSKKDFRQWNAGRGARGEMREAITMYKVLKRFSSVDEKGNKNDFTYVEVYPKTGRTHQIRVHFKFINHPLICDKLYAPKKDCVLGMDRLALHAYTIEFDSPSSGHLKIESELPKDFQQALEK